MVIGFWRWLASLELAVILLVVLAVVLAWATIVEARQGAEYAQWYFYYSQWFIWVLGLLSANVLAATLIRLPWKRSQTGFVIAHLGVLVLMGGSLLTFLRGIDGQLSFAEGETADSILLAHRTQLTVIGPGGSDRSPIEFSFTTGPVDWGRDDPLDFGRTDGIGLRVLKFFHQARGEVEWVADESMRGEPALKLAAGGAHKAARKPLWCVANPFGSQAARGDVGFEFRQAPVASMKDDFLALPLDKPPGQSEQGLLVAYWQGRRYEIAVGDNVGKKVPLGESGPSVVIAAYHANAVSEGGGRFTSRGTAPENPMLQLEIYLPQSEDPIPEIAYARNPFVSYDLMRAGESPVKFWYHHPAVPARPGVEFLETPDGKLYCRLGIGGRYEPRGEVKVGDSFEVVSGFDVSILDYLPHARQEITFQPAELSGATKARLESAALVEVSFAGKTHEIWLRRSQQPDGFETIETERGPVRLSLGYERAPLGFSLKLLDFKRGMNPGRMGNASFASKVQLLDDAQGIDRQREISMNRPLAHGKFTFYQSSFSEMPDGTALSVLSAAHDPGRLLKYLGSVMLCVGIFIVYYMKSVFRTRRRPDAGGAKKVKGASSGKAARGVSRKATGVLVAWLALGASAFAERLSGADFDWDPWRHLPVLDDGRRKPLDTLARETLQELTGDRSFRDPKSGARLSATAMYMEMLFDWQGWDEGADPNARAGLGAIGVYYASHEPDKWDRADLFPVNNSSLRKALGMAKHHRRISPLKLGQAEIRDPRTDRETPFLSWAEERYREESEDTSTLEKGGLELLNKLLSYHAHRMGERLYLLPVEGSEYQDWVSFDTLVRFSYDDETDPTGGLRKVQSGFAKARAAYLDGSAETFESATATLIADARKIGPRLGPYPDQGTIRMELAYNRSSPFRLAWWFTLISFAAFVLNSIIERRGLFAAGLATFGAGLAAMSVGFLMRTLISGRAPVTNLYESVVFVAFGALAFGLVFGLRSRKMSVLASAAVVATVALLLADYCPSVLDPSIRPLVPVLRSNTWLAVHVITIMLSYAAFAVALSISNVTLGYYLVGSKNREAINTQARFTYKLLQAGVWLLVVGTILGAMWADYSWGRFWGWDRKEVWALITLLGYLAVVHARLAGWIGNFGLTAWSAVCFVMVIWAWYGVNLMGPGGLHNYGLSGDSGAIYVIAALLAQLLYVGAAAARHVGGSVLARLAEIAGPK